MLRSGRHEVGVDPSREARRILVRGTVQGVGFRPFVYRLADETGVFGWVRNAEDGVEIHVEGPRGRLDAFVTALGHDVPTAAEVSEVESTSSAPAGFKTFEILASGAADSPTVHISPDLPVCGDCRNELSDPSDRRAGYPYINCTNCGPRYTIIERLPYDRANTTMVGWAMCDSCAAEYSDPLNRRYHAQPTACPLCGPTYQLTEADRSEIARGPDALTAAAAKLRDGAICAVKGLGGYLLACDARNADSIQSLRKRKFRKEKPFALMVRDLEAARRLVDLSPEAEELLTSTARPIVLMARAKGASSDANLPNDVPEDVAPGNVELGVMLPYAPLHVMLFESGAPEALVLTSANRSSEPIAYQDDEAFERLRGIADYFLVGERPIARRVDDSVARVGHLGPVVLRRSRGYSPAPVTTLPTERPILALGADLKNAITLVVNGEAYVSQHIGDLAHFEALTSFEETVRDLLDMYRIREDDLLVVHDAHPQYLSTQRSDKWGGEHLAAQHHRAHVASVIAEKQAYETRVVGLALDGTGYGDDGSIWGGEVFVGSVKDGFERTSHLRRALLPGGDAAAEHPLQAAAGFLASIVDLPDLEAEPFNFTERYGKACRLLDRNVRTFTTTSTGRLFDTAAALLGFARPITFEGQAAIWLEQLAARSSGDKAYPFPDLDYRPLLTALIEDIRRGVMKEDAARAFHLGLSKGFADVAAQQAAEHGLATIVMSGGVFQNQILVGSIVEALQSSRLTVWMNSSVPPNDGGISLGQAALGAHERFRGV